MAESANEAAREGESSHPPHKPKQSFHFDSHPSGLPAADTVIASISGEVVQRCVGRVLLCDHVGLSHLRPSSADAKVGLGLE